MASKKDQDFLDFVLDQLTGLRRISSKRMFGGIGIYCGDYFFAIIDDGRLYFLTNDTTRKRYTTRGMEAFEYAPGKVITSYYEVPIDILEDDASLREWAEESVSVQREKKSAPPISRTRARR